MKSDIQGRLAVIALAPVETANGYGRIFHHGKVLKMKGLLLKYVSYI